MQNELRIYNISEQITEAAAQITIDEETGEVIGKDALDALIIQGQEKVLDTARYLQTREFDLDAMERIYKNLGERIKAEKKRQAWLKDRMLDAFEFFGVKKIEAPDMLLRVQKNPESLCIVDEAQLPKEFIKTVTTETIDKAALKAAIKAGLQTEGAYLKQSNRLVIK